MLDPYTFRLKGVSQQRSAGCVKQFAETIAIAMHVDRREGESVEQLIRRFNKGVVSERITKTFREKMHFVSKGEQRKEKRRRAERNRRKRERISTRF